MNRYRFGSAVALTLALCFSLFAYAVEPARLTAELGNRNRVVIQVSDNDPAKWNLALNNANNMQKDLGATNIDIEIVAYGPGIGMLKADSVAGNRVNDAIASGIKVMACENTMQAQKLAKADMLGNVGYVSSGVVELVQKQQQGWAYLRP